MSKGGKRSRSTRPSTTRALDHTVDRASRRSQRHSTTPLMRTVLSDTGSGPWPRAVTPNRIKPALRSPTVMVRASDRSSVLARKMQSPFLQATAVNVSIPARSIECARRNIRREVLFARKGLSGSSPKRKRSKVRC